MSQPLIQAAAVSTVRNDRGVLRKSVCSSLLAERDGALGALEEGWFIVLELRPVWDADVPRVPTRILELPLATERVVAVTDAGLPSPHDVGHRLFSITDQRSRGVVANIAPVGLAWVGHAIEHDPPSFILAPDQVQLSIVLVQSVNLPVLEASIQMSGFCRTRRA